MTIIIFSLKPSYELIERIEHWYSASEHLISAIHLFMHPRKATLETRRNIQVMPGALCWARGLQANPWCIGRYKWLWWTWTEHDLSSNKDVQSFNMMFKDLQNLGPTLKCEVHCPCPKSSTHFLLSLQMSTEYALHIHVRIHDIVEYITIKYYKTTFVAWFQWAEHVAVDGTV